MHRDGDSCSGTARMGPGLQRTYIRTLAKTLDERMQDGQQLAGVPVADVPGRGREEERDMAAHADRTQPRRFMQCIH